MNNISLDNPYLLLIALPLIVLFTIPFAIAVRKSNRNWHNVVSQILHVLMAIIIGFAAARPSYTTVLTETDIYVVADVSYSAKRNLDTIDSYIKNLTLPSNAKLGLVCFGKDYELVSELGNPKKVASVKKATVDDTETNIAEALTYTGTLFGAESEKSIKRIVLITDGKQSDRSDNTALRRAVDELIDVRGIKVDAIFLDDNPSLDSKEVQITGVRYTQTAYLDSVQEAVIEIDSSYDTAAVISVKRGDEVLPQLNADLTVGRNNVGFALDTSVPGAYDYEVTVFAERDINQNNNTYSFTQTVSDEMNVLVLTHSFDDVMAAVNRYGDKGRVDIYENDTSYLTSLKELYVGFQSSKTNITFHLDNDDVPYTVEELCKYDQIVLADVDLNKLKNGSSFVSSLDAAVAVLGKSLVTYGNLHIQNAEDVGIAALGDMLPVNFGNTDSKLYTIIMDTSRSMNQLDHLNITKQLVKRLVNTLPDDTYVTLITFNSDAEVIQAVTPLTEREEILSKIENFEVVQGTVLGSGLKRTAEYITPLEFDEKQVLLITDGLSYSVNVEDNPVTVAQQMYASGIITSVFDVGRPGDEPDGSNRYNEGYAAAFRLLTEVAEAGRGSHYYSRNLENLDDVTFGELSDDLTLTVVERDTTVSVQRLQQNDPVLDGLSEEDKLSIPNVKGYMYCGSKSSATTVLTVNHKRTDSSEFTTEKPLYAYQNYGNGKVSTFTSSLGGDWVSDWNSGIGLSLLENVFELNIPSERIDTPYVVNVIREGKATRVEVTPTEPQPGSIATISVTKPNGETESKEMGFTGSTYYYEFQTADVGKYDVGIKYTFREDYITNRAVYVCYLDEYDAFDVFEPSPLDRAISNRRGGGTVSRNGKLNLESDRNEVDKYVQDLTVPLLIVAVAMFVVDIIIRKLKWDDIKSFFGFGKKKEVKK
ncbi:MAG: VWA domain-containing protein [Clostridiales bacterium]|nr:VWA domain-containing protein [Clostridiales bacterium]